MGLPFRELILKEEISLKDLANKTLAIDSFNLLYQFLTTIRSPDGSLFTNSRGQVTSHLIGLFNRVTKLKEYGLKLIFVFDGKPPLIKEKTRMIRKEMKKEAALKWQEAKEKGEITEMYKFASRTTTLTSEMVEEAKELIQALGCPIVEAPAEGEAQCAYLVKKGEAYASVSQDFDSLIFGCPLLIRNLSIEGKRKKIGQFNYQIIKPEKISLVENLNHLGIDLDQLIVLAILVGTDYNPGGLKGIGPKTALKLVKENPLDFEALFQKVNWNKSFPYLDWKEIFYTIKKMPLTDNYSLEFKPPNEKKIVDFLIKKHNFSEERVRNKLKKLLKKRKTFSQTVLNSF